MKKSDFVHSFDLNNKNFSFYSLRKVALHYQINLESLSLSFCLFLENMLHHSPEDNIKDFENILFAMTNHEKIGEAEINYFPGRVILQDYTGIPLLVDLASMRDAALKNNINPESINPKVPTSLIIDHSFHANYSGAPDAISRNMELEFERNMERYQFVKWSQHAFSNFTVIPPGNGIIHQINIEYLAQGVLVEDN